MRMLRWELPYKFADWIDSDSLSREPGQPALHDEALPILFLDHVTSHGLCGLSQALPPGLAGFVGLHRVMADSVMIYLHLIVSRMAEPGDP